MSAVSSASAFSAVAGPSNGERRACSRRQRWRRSSETSQDGSSQRFFAAVSAAWRDSRANMSFRAIQVTQGGRLLRQPEVRGMVGPEAAVRAQVLCGVTYHSTI